MNLKWEKYGLMHISCTWKTDAFLSRDMNHESLSSKTNIYIYCSCYCLVASMSQCYIFIALFLHISGLWMGEAVMQAISPQGSMKYFWFWHLKFKPTWIQNI